MSKKKISQGRTGHCSCDAATDVATQAGILPDSTGESLGFWTALRQNVKKAGYDLTDNPASVAQVLGFRVGPAATTQIYVLLQMQHPKSEQDTRQQPIAVSFL